VAVVYDAVTEGVFRGNVAYPPIWREARGGTMKIRKSVAAGAVGLALAMTGGGIAAATTASAATTETPACAVVQDQIGDVEANITNLKAQWQADEAMGYSFWIVLDQIVLDYKLGAAEIQLNGLRAQEYEVCITRVAGGGGSGSGGSGGTPS
jgi:hypothetical protein